MRQPQRGRAHVLDIVGPRLEVESRIDYPPQRTLQPESQSALQASSSRVRAHQKVTISVVIAKPHALIVRSIRPRPIDVECLRVCAVVFFESIRVHVESIEQ